MRERKMWDGSKREQIDQWVRYGKSLISTTVYDVIFYDERNTHSHTVVMKKTTWLGLKKKKKKKKTKILPCF
jgi:hypothetical protein